MSSDDKPATQQITTSSSEPYAGQKPFLEAGFERARTDVLEQPGEYYPNSTVVPFSPTTLQGLDLQQTRALAGSPVTQAAQNQVQQTAQGDYLTAGNPYAAQAIQNATAPLAQRFQEDVIPGIQSSFNNAGRFGSGLQARQQERAGEAVANQMGDIATNMGLQIYGDERQRQIQASQLAPQLAATDYSDIQALKGVGVEQESMAGNILQDDISRFNYAQQAPKDALAQYMALVSGGGYNTRTDSKPLYRNEGAEYLAGATQGASTLNTLFGKQGIFSS
tara:strand:- start:769 stop:1602 length:834 start_codon:yes stop_codon:yes gene_type:complete